MKVLHIANSISSQAYVSLFVGLSHLGIVQSVFAYFRGHVFRTAHLKEQELCQLDVKYLSGVKWWHRILYHRKLRYVYEGLKKQLDPAQYDVLHAETLFSDGGVAFKVWQHYKIPYIVNVRSTDIEVFLRFLPHTWWMGRLILLHATKIVFISPALQRRFCHHPLIKSLLPKIKGKFEICPNAIDQYWLERRVDANEGLMRENELLYVGSFLRRKNVLRLVKAVLRLQRIVPNIHLSLVGAGGGQLSVVLKYVHKYPSLFSYLGVIKDKDILIRLYRQSKVFAMPSWGETLGLVYIEALSQGCQVLYAQKDSIDGMFPEKRAWKVNPRSVRNIANVLITMLSDRTTCPNGEIDFHVFDKAVVANRYRHMYEESIIV